ncbi:MAG: hypothetical protein FWG35_07335, partial [Spirochaetaceae bacterium]|nr:hypothetical protein [Spirochaetaceae bacterium]
AGSITYTVDDRPGGVMSVHVFVVAEDTWNALALPHFKYDSNRGTFLGIRFRDNNFFGSMEPLKIDFDYIIGTSNVSNGLQQAVQAVIPFRLFEHNWRLRLLERADYTSGFTSGNMGWNINAEAGLAVDFPYGEQIWTLEYVQGYFYKDDDIYDDHYYHTSKLLFGSDFALPVDLGWLGSLKYRPDVFARVSYRQDKDLSPERRGVEPGFSHKLFFARIGWIENFREGMDFSVTNENARNLREGEWRNNLQWAFIGHTALSVWDIAFGISGRVSGFYQFFREKGPENDDAVGKPIRGILDDRMHGDAAVFVNLDLPVKMWVWFLDPYIELQAGPFFDIAMIKRKGEYFRREGLYYGAGLEAVLFLKFISRSIYFRASLGIDLEAFFKDHKLTGPVPEKEMDSPPPHGTPQWKRLEAFIGFGHSY